MLGLSSRLVAGDHIDMISEESNKCAEICDQLWCDKAPPTNLTFHGAPIEFTGTFNYYQDMYTKGWLDATKACASTIRGVKPEDFILDNPRIDHDN